MFIRHKILIRTFVLAALLLFSIGAAAQFTVVTGTVTDPNGIPYAYGTISAQLITAGTTPTLNGAAFTMTGSAGLNSAGSFTMRLADSTVMSPNLQWQFTVCSAAGTVNPAIGTGSQCFNAGPLTISGSSESITSTLNAAALALTQNIGSSSGANVHLSNLSAVAINTSLLPGTTNTINLGSSSDIWASVFASTYVSGLGTASSRAYQFTGLAGAGMFSDGSGDVNIGSAAGAALYLTSNSNTETALLDASGNFIPGVTNTQNLGGSSDVWAAGYFTNLHATTTVFTNTLSCGAIGGGTPCTIIGYDTLGDPLSIQWPANSTSPVNSVPSWYTQQVGSAAKPSWGIGTSGLGMFEDGSNNLAFAVGATEIFSVSGSAVAPIATNTYTLGSASHIWSSVLATTFNAATGYQIGGTATSGNYLRGNGTNFVSSTIQAGDISGIAANLALSNLSGVAINTALLPGVTNSIALGSSSFVWSNLFATVITEAGLTPASSTGALSVPQQVGFVSCTQATCATSATTIATGSSSTSVYRADVAVDCTASTSTATVNVTISYTDPGGTAQTFSGVTAAACTTLGSSSAINFTQPFSAENGTAIRYNATTTNSPTGYQVRVAILQESVS